MLEQTHLKVRGKVQGVGFRYATAVQARGAGLTGWVRNLEDGSVEILAEGPSDELNAFIQWCGQGPPTGTVQHVEILDRSTIPACGQSDFKLLR